MSNRHQIRFGIKHKMLIGFLLVGIVSSVIVGMVTYNTISKHEMEKVKEKLLMTAGMGASIIDVDVHSQLKPGAENTEEYIRIIQKLREFKEMSKLEYIYTFVPYNENSVKFVLDTDESEDAAYIGKEYELSDSIREAFKGKMLTLDEPDSDDWGTFISGYVPLKNSAGEIVAVVGADITLTDVEKILGDLKKFIFAGIVLSVLISVLIALLLSHRISRPALLLVDKLDDVVRNSGDLTQAIKITSKDEMGVLAGKTNDLLANIRGIVERIRETTLVLNENTKEISSALHNTTEASETIAKAMSEISSGVSGQANLIHESTDKLEILSRHIDTLSESSGKISSSAQVAMEYSGEGNEAIDDLRQKYKVTGEIVEIVSSTVSKLESKSDEIGKIIEVITSISSQTNLLALNAAIEAARAGEQGKGFAVVAEEIRKLAESTTISAKEISKHINDVRSQSKETADAMSKVIETISAQSVSIENANKVLSHITSTVSDISENIISIDGAVKKVYAQKEDALASIKEIYHTAENMVAVTEEVNASSEEQHAVVENVSVRVEKLMEMSGKLESTVTKFKI